MRISKFILTIIIFWSCSICATRIRVLLDQCQSDHSKTWTIESSDGFSLAGPDSEKKIFTKNKYLHVKNNKLGTFINNKRLRKEQIFICPRRGFFSFEDKQYDGYVQIRIKNKKVYFVNVINLEDYVFSVLRTEGWPGWPCEVNKVFAIMCRSYAISQLLTARKIGQPFDIGNTNAHQTYKGVHPVGALREAADQTKDVFLAYEGKPILAMFDSCCGGVVPAYIHVNGVSFEKAPYLERKYPCTFCKKCKIFSWSIVYGEEHLYDLFKSRLKRIKKIKNVEVIKRDKAGLVEKVVVSDGNKKEFLTGKQVYSLLREIKSFCFSIYKNGKNSFIFKGRGFGHHIGLCQWGAREMVRQNWDYKRILQFYYPETQFMVLRNGKGE
ncbi:SpoIID/LytB domain-containing protein [bacterium]|jgi:stage II sporulation protein D|nr:SpoIID/LytB domain-containing protein [bacterium]